MAILLTIGLVVMQGYLVQKSYLSEKKQVEQNINSALDKVLIQIESKEYATLIEEEYNQELAQLLSKRDSVQIVNSLITSNFLVKDSIISRDGEDVTIRIVEGSTSDSAAGIFTEARVIKENIFEDTLRALKILQQDYHALDTLQNQLHAYNIDYDIMQSRVEVVLSVLSKIYDKGQKPTLQQRVNIKYLDSLLRDELKSKGILNDFNFSIINDKNKVAFFNTEIKNYKTDLKSSNYKRNLFPNEVEETRDGLNYLLLEVNDENNIAKSKIVWVLVLSILLVLFVVGGFYYTIRTISRQKKLSVIKTDFINNMTHELKTPISTIGLACEALSDPDISQSKALNKSYLNMISDENIRLGTLVERVLQSAVIDKGELKVKPENINIVDLINQVVKRISLQIESKGGSIAIENNIVKEIVSADRIHLTNVLYNLIDNANKYSLTNPNIKIIISKEVNHVSIAVIDKGIGISKENQKKVFEKLYRVPTGNVHNVKGFGLGLSYVQAVAEMHNGTIEVKSELDKGSSFILKLPYGKEN